MEFISTSLLLNFTGFNTTVYIGFSWPLGQLCQVRSKFFGTGWIQEPGLWEIRQIRALDVHLGLQVEWICIMIQEKNSALRPSTLVTSYFKYQDPPLLSQGDCQTPLMLWPKLWNNREQVPNLKASHETHVPKRCLERSLNRTCAPASRKPPRTIRWFTKSDADTVSSWRRKRFSSFSASCETEPHPMAIGSKAAT